MEIRTLFYDVTCPALGSKHVTLEYGRQQESWTLPVASVYTAFGHCSKGLDAERMQHGISNAGWL